MLDGTYEPLYVYSVHLENGDLVQKYASTKEPPKVGEKLILDVDLKFKRYTVLGVNKAPQHDHEVYFVQVSADLIND